MPLPAFGDRLASDALVGNARVAALALILEGSAHLGAGSRERHRQREQVLAGLERVEAQHDLQVHRADEELALEDELLPHQRREPVRSCTVRSSGVRLDW
jgi:hypothetical protein